MLLQQLLLLSGVVLLPALLSAGKIKAAYVLYASAAWKGISNKALGNKQHE